jgi:hypothetical protein
VSQNKVVSPFSALFPVEENEFAFERQSVGQVLIGPFFGQDLELG